MEDTKKDAVKNETGQDETEQVQTVQNKETQNGFEKEEKAQKEEIQENVSESGSVEDESVQDESAQGSVTEEEKKESPADEDFFYDDDQAYEQRRAARLERLRRRKRKRKNRRIAIGTVAALAVIGGVSARFYGDEMKVIVQKQQATVSDLIQKVKESREQKEAAEADAQADTAQNTNEETQTDSQSNADGETQTDSQENTDGDTQENTGEEMQADAQVQNGEEAQASDQSQAEGVSGSDEQQDTGTQLSAEDKAIYKQAKRYAAQYDYDRAIETLKTSAVWETNEKFQKAIRVYNKKKASCVSWPIEEVTHVFYHTLIVDTARAFDGDYNSGNYDQVMTTIDEFNQITQSMYDKGYVMVSLYDMATADENGNMTQGEILLPPGKVPFVLSQDDVCYYHYMDGDGFASKLVVDEDGKVRNEYIEEDGSVSVGDYDMVPLIDRFVEEHPDFSYHGAKGIVALTGYNGILGYRTDISYETRPDDLDDNKVQWLNEHPDFDLNKEREEASAVAQAMKDEGWIFASHTWGHQNVSEISLEKLQSDTQKFKENVDPLIGGTDIIIFAFGADLAGAEDYSGEKFEYLKGQGYNYYCNVDSSQYFVQLRSNYLRQGRRNLDGYRMYYNPELLSDLFDAQAVFDPARPVPVPPMG